MTVDGPADLLERGPAATADAFRDLPVYGVADDEKQAVLVEALHQLTLHHVDRNAEYRHLLSATGVDHNDRPTSIGELTPVTVRQFKGPPFRSIPAGDVATTLRSSGTSGMPSTIHLDRVSAATQSRTLSTIMQQWLGPKRLPMLIADHRAAIGSSGEHTARGAGIQGMAMLGRHHTYALTDDLTLDLDAVGHFVEQHGDGPIFVYGFTFVVWQHFLGALVDHGIRLPEATLVHGGGWKRLQSQAVDRITFRARAREAGITRVHDYYGLVEQTGSIFVECEFGRLHTPVHADVLVRDRRTGAELPAGATGLLQLMSVLPTSYPGHVLLTEDLGRVLGVDDCPCGRLGRYFEVHGRLPRAEPRGCSDAFAAAPTTGTGLVNIVGSPVEVALDAKPVAAFDETSLAFLDDLSRELRSRTVARAHPGLGALGFWLRPSGLADLRRRFDAGATSARRMAAGPVLHLTPGNVDLLFAYVWALSLLVGNSDVIRLSRRESDARSTLIDLLHRLLEDPRHATIAERIAIVTYDHDDAITARLSATATRRVIWGGDQTVAHLRSVPAGPSTRDLVFPNRRSAAVVSAAAVLDGDDAERLAERLHRDAYSFEQKACASPSLILWLPDGDVSSARDRFWSELARVIDRHETEIPAATLMDKLVAVQSMGRSGSMQLRPVDDHRLHVLVIDGPHADRPVEHPGGGLFYEAPLRELGELNDWITPDLQTLSCVGVDPGEVGRLLDEQDAPWPDRVVPAGHALDFDVVWDGMDLFEQLSRQVSAADEPS